MAPLASKSAQVCFSCLGRVSPADKVKDSFAREDRAFAADHDDMRRVTFSNGIFASTRRRW
jgi:hypothetical protein